MKHSAGVFLMLLVVILFAVPLFGQQEGSTLHYFGAAIGLGIIVSGAGYGIGRFTMAAAESIARQPEAAAQITAAVNLPLFLLEGVAILGEVFCLLIVLMK